MHRLDGALRPEIAAPRDATEAPPLLRKLLAGREVDAGDLEQRDLLVARVHACRRPRRGPAQGRPQDRVVGRQRVGEPRSRPGSISGRQAPRVGLREAGADEDVLDQAPQRCSLREPAGRARRSGSVNGTRSSRTRATSSMRSISRVTSRARQVGTVTCQSSPTSKPSRSRIARCSSGGVEGR